MSHLFPYSWRISDGYPASGITFNGLKVFGTFICGGGSSMGYKLAGFEHLGGVEIDKTIADIYSRNHYPRYLYIEDLRLFNERTDLPDELYNLDILDGSPPCSTFSIAGQREAAWGKEKIFAEGQALQTLDDLVFVYCNTIAKLKPKTFILENVKGLTLGNAKSYLRRIYDFLFDTGYDCQTFVLNAATMGVPQKRERCFVIGRRRDLGLPKLSLSFHEPPIPFARIIDRSDTSCNIAPQELEAFKKYQRGDRNVAMSKQRGGGALYGIYYRVDSREQCLQYSLHKPTYPRKHTKIPQREGAARSQYLPARLYLPKCPALGLPDRHECSAYHDCSDIPPNGDSIL